MAGLNLLPSTDMINLYKVQNLTPDSRVRHGMNPGFPFHGDMLRFTSPSDILHRASVHHDLNLLCLHRIFKSPKKLFNKSFLKRTRVSSRLLQVTGISTRRYPKRSDKKRSSASKLQSERVSRENKSLAAEPLKALNPQVKSETSKPRIKREREVKPTSQDLTDDWLMDQDSGPGGFSGSNGQITATV